MFNDLDDFSEIQAAFMRSFYEATYALGEEAARMWDNVAELDVISDAIGHDVELESDEVYLRWVKAVEPGKGYGGQALEWLFGLADKCSVVIKLHADADDEDIIDQENLEAMYMRRGFEPCGDKLFVRYPDW